MLLTAESTRLIEPQKQLLPKLVVLFLVLLACACDRESWQQFRSKDGDYSVLLPGAPTTEKLVSSAAQGPLTIHLVTVQQPHRTYTVAYNNYPQSILDKSSPDALLDLAVEGALGESGRLVSSSPLSLNGHTGRSVEAQLPQGLTFRGRFFLAGPRLYQVSILESPHARESDRQQFWGSFKIGLAD